MNEIEISFQPAPQWGKTAHEATLSCPHGSGTWTVYGSEETRTRMAREMAPALRSRTRCQCELAGVATS